MNNINFYKSANKPKNNYTNKPKNKYIMLINLALYLALYLGLAACSSLPKDALDPPMTETLKQKITKARNAIIETRRTLARATGSTYVQELKIRLAELLSDEARAHYQVARAREGISNKSLQVPQVKTLKQQAVTLYQEFLKDYPQSDLRPRALYNMGQEYRELGDYDNMRKSFEQIASEHAQHPLSNEALLILGGDYFDRGKLDEAATRFAKITAGPIHKVSGLANYKLAWVKVNQDQCAEAIKAFEQGIVLSHQWLSAQSNSRDLEGSQYDVRREALVDMVYCYSKERSDKGAVEYFKGLAYDRGPLVAALEKLSRRYIILERNEGLRDVSRALLDLGPDHQRRREDTENLHSAIKKLKDYKTVGEDVARITATFNRVMRSTRLTPSEKSSILIRFERLSRDLATSAQASLEKRLGTKTWAAQSSDVLQLEHAYARYLETFGSRAVIKALVSSEQNIKLQTQLNQSQEGSNKQDQADKSESEGFDINQNILDILGNLSVVYSRSGKDYLAAQRFYERASRLKDSEGSEDAYQAVLHFQKALSAGDKTRGELVISRALLRRAASVLLTKSLSKEQGPKVRYAIALTYYEEGRLAKAIEYLTAVATEYPSTVQGDSALMLVLDALKQQSAYDELVNTGRRFLKLGMSSALKPRIKSLVAQAEQLALDELALEASGVDGGDVSAELIDLAQNSTGSLAERALLNAFVAAQSEADFEAMKKVAALIQSGHPKSSQLVGVYSSLARSAAEQLYIDEALNSYKQAAQLSPNRSAQLKAAAAELSYKVGDINQALTYLEEATKDAKSDERIFALYTRLLIDHRDSNQAWTALQKLKDRSSPSIAAGIGYLQVLRKSFDEAEETVQSVIEAGEEVDPYSRALGLYALAEVNTHFLKEFTPGDSTDELAEWVTLMELAEQSYLRVVRTGQSKWGSAALNRLAALSEFTSSKIVSFKPPSELSASNKARFADGFKQRAKLLQNQKTQSLKACQELGLLRGLFPSPVRQCLNKQLMNNAEVPPSQMTARSKSGALTVAQADRSALARNPNDIKAAVRLGQALLKAQEPQLARLSLAQALQGGGAEVHNLYGIACAKSGDYEGAISGFGKAAVSGLSAGIDNARKLLKTNLSVPQINELTKGVWKVSISGGETW